MLRLTTTMVFVLFLSCGITTGQGIEWPPSPEVTMGQEFLVSLPPIDPVESEKPLPQPLVLMLSSPAAAHVRVRSDGFPTSPKIDSEYTLSPFEVVRVPISTSYLVEDVGKIDGRVISVVSDQPLHVQVAYAWTGNGELMRVHPIRPGWGTRYRTVHSFHDSYPLGNGIRHGVGHATIVAAYDGTVVDVVSKRPLMNGPDLVSLGGGRYTTTLDSGQQIYLKWAPDTATVRQWESDPTGTLITSTKPIGVFSGMTKAAIMRMPGVLPNTGPDAGPATMVRNNLLEMLLPENHSDTLFYTLPCRYTPVRVHGSVEVEGMDPTDGDVIRILALTDNTVVYQHHTNDSGWAEVATLQAGESYRDTIETEMRVWRTSEPAQAYQYGKSWARPLGAVVKPPSDKAQAIPTPTEESGMPMFMAVPGTRQAVSRGVFHAPSGMDNFLNLVCLEEHVADLRLDGKPLNDPVFNGVRWVVSGPHGNVVGWQLAVEDGDHRISNTDTFALFNAWVYGSLDGLQTGRSYGTPLSVDLRSECNGSLKVTKSTDCWTLSGTAEYVGDDCGEIALFYPIQTTNVEIVDFSLSGTRASWEYRVVNTAKDAQLVFNAHLTSGKQYSVPMSVSGERSTVFPEVLNVGIRPIGLEVCTTAVIRNTSSSPVTITSIVAKVNEERFRITADLPRMLQPNERYTAEICVTPWSTDMIIDTIIWKTPCGSLGEMQVSFSAESPRIFCTDQQWGIVPVGDTLIKRIQIINSSIAQLTVTGYDTSAVTEHFSFTGAQGIFPLVIDGGERVNLDVLYHPRSRAGAPHTCEVRIYSNAVGVDSVTVWNGTPVDTTTSVHEERALPPTIAPSPVSLSRTEFVTVTTEGTASRVTIVDVNGAEVYQLTATSTALHIPVSAFRTPGWYGIVVENVGMKRHIPLLVIE